jgi:two-component system alkaline phosphatase synthesis response regulator PhoP
MSEKLTSSELRSGPLSQRKPPYRILIVDDEENDRDLSRRLLIRAGYDVVGAVDGDAAWEAIQIQHFDLMITDNSMPKVSGVELVKKLRAAGAKLEVVFLTGEFPVDQFDRYPWLRTIVILTKPVPNGQLLSAVEKILNEERSVS